MKYFALLLLLSVATSAGAVIDPDPDQMGLYFDPAGNSVCTTSEFAHVVPLYVLYTKPTLPEIRGFECTITLGASGTVLSILTNETYPVEALNLASHSIYEYGFIVGFEQPVPTAPVTLLAQLDVIYLQEEPLQLHLGPAVPASLGSQWPVILAGDYSLLPVGVSAPDGPAALINAPECTVVDTDPTPWGAVKAMYRLAPAEEE